MSPPPLGLLWDKKITNSNRPNIQDYRLYKGKIDNSPLIYLGTSTFLGMETEIQLYIVENMIVKAILILGPKGIDIENCLDKFNTHVNLLKSKYGKPTLKKTETSFLKEELFYTHECYLYKTGMKRKRVFWKTEHFNIEALLLGDEEGYYIETVYTNRKAAKMYIQKNKNIIYKKISKKENNK